eukprot:Hpha_TRINITY_DN15426_c3_g12::TRINITY_DN15426_c3_g12_i1::g.176630::m.176630
MILDPLLHPSQHFNINPGGICHNYRQYGGDGVIMTDSHTDEKGPPEPRVSFVVVDREPLGRGADQIAKVVSNSLRAIRDYREVPHILHNRLARTETALQHTHVNLSVLPHPDSELTLVSVPLYLRTRHNALGRVVKHLRTRYNALGRVVKEGTDPGWDLEGAGLLAFAEGSKPVGHAVRLGLPPRVVPHRLGGDIHESLAEIGLFLQKLVPVAQFVQRFTLVPNATVRGVLGPFNPVPALPGEVRVVILRWRHYLPKHGLFPFQLRQHRHRLFLSLLGGECEIRDGPRRVLPDTHQPREHRVQTRRLTFLCGWRLPARGARRLLFVLDALLGNVLPHLALSDPRVVCVYLKKVLVRFLRNSGLLQGSL